MSLYLTGSHLSLRQLLEPLDRSHHLIILLLRLLTLVQTDEVFSFFIVLFTPLITTSLAIIATITIISFLSVLIEAQLTIKAKFFEYFLSLWMLAKFLVENAVRCRYLIVVMKGLIGVSFEQVGYAVDVLRFKVDVLVIALRVLLKVSQPVYHEELELVLAHALIHTLQQLL